MKKYTSNITSFLVATLLLVASAPSFAVELTPLNTFAAGDIIVADEINENFANINSKIDAIALTPGPQGIKGADCVDAPDHTADLCALYIQLYDNNQLGTLPLPSICTQ